MGRVQREGSPYWAWRRLLVGLSPPSDPATDGGDRVRASPADEAGESRIATWRIRLTWRARPDDDSLWPAWSALLFESHENHGKSKWGGDGP